MIRHSTANNDNILKQGPLGVHQTSKKTLPVIVPLIKAAVKVKPFPRTAAYMSR